MTDQELFDRFKYPNGTLKNKRGITDATELARLEFQMVNANMVALLQHAAQFPRIETIDQLTVVHRFLFDDLYAWAGRSAIITWPRPGTSFRTSILSVRRPGGLISCYLRPTRRSARQRLC